jgi:hypothetical protein
MGSKKRIFYTTPQKKIKQKRKNKYENVQELPKFKRYAKSLEFKQRRFIDKKFRKRKYQPLKATYDFYNKISTPLNLFTQKYKQTESVFNFLNVFIPKLTPKNLGVFCKLTKRGSIRLYKEPRLIKLLSFYFYKIRTLYLIDFEAQTLFQLGNSTQQYYLSTIGINYPYFTTMSSGRCLRKNFGNEVSKSLKKSLKLNKALVDYYFYQSTFDFDIVQYTHTFIKPFNKKALILFYHIQSNSAYYYTILGFRKYYKINFKTSRRIKKKIKKKFVTENLKHQPFKQTIAY